MQKSDSDDLLKKVEWKEFTKLTQHATKNEDFHFIWQRILCATLVDRM